MSSQIHIWLKENLTSAVSSTDEQTDLLA